MRKIKRLSLLLIVALVMSTISVPIGFDGNVHTVEAAAKISKKSATMVKGQKLKIKVYGIKKKKVKWTSSKKSIASVSKGVVTAKKNGTTTITAKVGSKKYKCKIKVTDRKVICLPTAPFTMANYNYRFDDGCIINVDSFVAMNTSCSKSKYKYKVSIMGHVPKERAGETVKVLLELQSKYLNCKVGRDGSYSGSSTFIYSQEQKTIGILHIISE